MTFKQGKFYEGDKVVPLEFGNWKQIEIIERVKALKEEGHFYAGLSFACPCGKVHRKTFDDGKVFKCECGAVYKFYYWDDEVPTIKMMQ